MLKEQEKDLNEALRKEAALERTNEDLKYRHEESEKKHKALQEKFQESLKKIEEHEAFAAYLQKQINEKGSFRQTGGYYPPPGSSYSSISRDGPSQLSNHSTLSRSRTALTGGEAPPRTDKYEPTIRRYEDRSKSPLPKRLAQQKDPEEQEESGSGFEQPRPVKFKRGPPAA